MRTRRFDTLTFARSTGEAEDVSLFHRERQRNIAAYASEMKLSSRGRFFNEDDLVEYDVLDYSIDATFSPDREWLEGRARLKIRVKSYALAALTLRLAEEFTVQSITSDELGRLMFLRVRNQNAVLVNLPFGRNSLFRIAGSRALPDFAAEFGAKTWAQFFLKFILSHPAVTAVIPGTDKPQYMIDNLGAGRGRLPDAAMRKRMIDFWSTLA